MLYPPGEARAVIHSGPASRAHAASLGAILIAAAHADRVHILILPALIEVGGEGGGLFDLDALVAAVGGGGLVGIAFRESQAAVFSSDSVGGHRVKAQLFRQDGENFLVIVDKAQSDGLPLEAGFIVIEGGVVFVEVANHEPHVGADGGEVAIVRDGDFFAAGVDLRCVVETIFGDQWQGEAGLSGRVDGGLCVVGYSSRGRLLNGDDKDNVPGIEGARVFAALGDLDGGGEARADGPFYGGGDADLAKAVKATGCSLAGLIVVEGGAALIILAAKMGGDTFEVVAPAAGPSGAGAVISVLVCVNGEEDGELGHAQGLRAAGDPCEGTGGSGGGWSFVAWGASELAGDRHVANGYLSAAAVSGAPGVEQGSE